MDLDTTGDIEIYFSIKITVLSFAGVEASVLIEERNGGDDLYIEFDVTAKLGVADCTTSGDAVSMIHFSCYCLLYLSYPYLHSLCLFVYHAHQTLDLVDITQTDFGEFSLSCTPAEWLTDVVDWVEGGINIIGNALSSAISECGAALVSAMYRRLY